MIDAVMVVWFFAACYVVGMLVASWIWSRKP